jgi:hypothetical protein
MEPTREESAIRLARLEELFANIEEMVALYRVVRDEKGHIVERILEDGNPALAVIAGVDSVDRIIGKTAGEIFGRAYADGNLPVIREAMETGAARTIESRREDVGRDYITTFRPLDSEHYLVTGRDITEVHEATNAVRRSRDLLDRAQQVANLGSWEWEITTDTLTWSDQTYNMLGVTQGEVQPSPELFLSRQPGYRRRRAGHSTLPRRVQGAAARRFGAAFSLPGGRRPRGLRQVGPHDRHGARHH